MGNSICQCDNLNQNLVGIMKKGDVSFIENNKQKANNNNNLLKISDNKNPENNTNINTNINNELCKMSNDVMSKANKSSKSGIKDNIVKKSEKEEESEEEEEEDDENEVSLKMKESELIKIKELIHVFDEFMNSYAIYMTEEEFQKEYNEKMNEIETKLTSITKDNKKIKELINAKIFDRPPLKFNSNNSIYKCMWNINGEKE